MHEFDSCGFSPQVIERLVERNFRTRRELFVAAVGHELAIAADLQIRRDDLVRFLHIAARDFTEAGLSYLVWRLRQPDVTFECYRDAESFAADRRIDNPPHRDRELPPSGAPARR